MKQLLQKYGVSTAIQSVVLLIVVGASLSFYNKMVMRRALETLRQTEVAKRASESFYENIRLMDISGRGYAILHEDKMLFYTPESARQRNDHNFHIIDSVFTAQGYNDPENYRAIRTDMDNYVAMFTVMVDLLKQNKYDEYKALLSIDRGATIWQHFAAFQNKFFAFEDQLSASARADYEAAMFRNTLVYILLLLLGLPTLGIALYNIREESKKRSALLLELEENNHQYLFDPGAQRTHDGKEIMQNSISNLKKAAEFITQISAGNYQVDWEGLHAQNQSLNQNNLVGQLLRMREQMKKAKSDDEKHLWTTEGLAKFSETIRLYQHHLADLSYQTLAFLTQYLHSQQSSLFVLRQDETETYLELAACYAFDRKKFVEKRIDIGQGLIGQTYREAQTVMLTELPQGYTAITSGLGDATPTCLLIVPMKYNDQVQAILEIASFHRYEPHQIAFLEKAGEFVASAIASAQTNEKTKVLLDQFRLQTEQLRAQEEELRQNMEELEATQENMRRNSQPQPTIAADSAPQPWDVE